MDERYAINLTNWIATTQGLSVREGYRQYSTGMTGYVETLIPYNGQTTGLNKLFACANNSFYDVTAGGAVGGALFSGLSNNRWTYTSFSGTAGTYLIVTNGVDAARHWNGTAWTTWTTVVTPAAPGETSGVSPSLLYRPMTHQRRLWFVQPGTSKAWYAPIDSVGGALTAFDFGRVFPRGGFLHSIGSWSQDGGNGINNYLVAVSSQGDVVIYQGTDPSDAATWKVQSTWALAAPTAEGCLMQFGGDMLYLCQSGLQPLSSYLQSTTTNASLTDVIESTISSLSTSQYGLAGFQLQPVLNKNLLILNVPQINPDQNVQFVFNTITKGWTLFTGWPAQCFAQLNGQTYFGGNGKVMLGFVGYRDNALSDGTGGSIYTAFAQQAYSYLEDNYRARQKRFTLARLNLITAAASPTFMLGVNTDFNTQAPSAIGSAVPSSVSLWGMALWDIAHWPAGATNYNAWQGIQAMGYNASITIAVSSLAATTWTTTDIVFEVGGVL